MSSDSWLFVNDNPDSAAKDKTRKQPEKAVKAHVQNVAFRKKTKERIERLKRASNWTKPVLPRPSTSALEQDRGKGDARDGPVQPLKFGSILTPKSLGKSDDDGDEELGWLPHEGSATSTGRNTLISLHTSNKLVRKGSPFTESVSPFGADRFDPFATYPIKLRKIDEAFLEQFYLRGFHTLCLGCMTKAIYPNLYALLVLNVMPKDEFGVKEGSPLIPTRHLVHTTSPAAFHAILATGGIHLAMIRGSAESSATTYHMAEAMRLVREGLQESKNPKTMAGLIQAVTELIAMDDMKGRFEEQRIHLMGMKMMIASHGGLLALENDPLLQMQIVYVITAASTDYLSTFDEMIHSPSSTNLAEIQSHVHQFQAFIKSIRQSQIWKTAPLRPRQIALFNPSTPVHNLLSTSIYSISSIGPGLGFDSSHGYAGLIYLTLVVLGYSEEPAESEEYLRTLQQTLILNNLDLRPNVHLFFFILLQREGKMRLDSAERAWSTIRLTQVLKRLSWSTALEIGQSMLEFLMCVEQGSTRTGVVGDEYLDIGADMVYEQLLPGADMLEGLLSRRQVGGD